MELRTFGIQPNTVSMKIESKTRKAVLGFVAFSVAITAIAVYFFYFVQQRKDELTKKNFGILAQISENIVSKVNTYDKNIGNVSSLLSGINAVPFGTKFFGATIANKPELPELFEWLKSQGAINKNLQAELLVADSTYNNGVQIEENSIAKVISVEDYPMMLIRQDLKSFLAPLLWQNDFDEYLILDGKSKLVYQNGELGIFEMNLDSILIEEGGNYSLKASSQKDIQLAGTDYKLFAYPFRINSSQKFVLIGLRSAKAFNEQGMSISSLTIVAAAALFFILLFSFPFLKIFLISKTERLNRFDLIMCVVSLFAVTGLVSLLTLDVFQYRKYSENNIEANLETVTKRIQANLEHELRLAIRQLQSYDSLYASGTNWAKDQVNILTDSTKPDLYPKYFNEFEMVFWVGKNGKQTNKWSVKSGNTSLIDVSERNYYKAIQDKTGWSWGKTNLFYLESIYSLNTGKSFAALSIPSSKTNNEVVAMTTELNSLFAPILTHGYKFALINTDGEVLFHSDKRRNLQENVLDDIGDKKALKAAMASRSFSIFSTTYHGEDYKACIEPLENWPIFLVTFYDQGYFKSANAEILSVSIILMTFYGLLVLLLFGFIYANSYSASKLHFTKTRLNWIIPHPENSTFYERVGIFNIVVGTTFVFSFLSIQTSLEATYTQLILLTFLAPVYHIGGNYLILNKKLRPGLFMKRHFPVILFFMTCLGAINSFALFHSFPFWQLFKFQAIILLSFLVLKLILPNRKVKWIKYPADYKLAILGFLLVTSLPPVFTFFKISHDTEFRLYTKLVQIDFAKELDKSTWNPWTSSGGEVIMPTNVHYSPLVNPIIVAKEPDNQLKHDPAFNKLYSFLRIVFSDRLGEMHNLNDPDVVGENWEWIDGLDHVTLDFNSPKFIHDDKHIEFHSDLSSYDLELEKNQNIASFIGIAGLLVLLLYFLISFIFRKTVMSKMLQQSNPLLLDMDLFGSILSGETDQAARHHNVFLIGLPNAGKTTFINDRIISRNPATYKVDLTELRDLSADEIWEKVDPNAQVIILDHFEFGLHDSDIIRKKLVVMENFVKKGNLRLIVVSSAQPLELIDEEPLLHMTDIDAQESKILSERWVRVLGNFYKSYFTIAFNPDTNREELDDEDPNELIESECRHGNFLKSLEGGLKKYVAANKVTNDEIILKIQSLTNFYYYSIWKSCTAEEKYLLYDIAQDGIVNTRNIKVISSLINKGLVISRGTLTLLNRSFRNFILSTVDPSEALSLEMQVNTSGTWKVIRVPLLMTILALAIFLFYTQQSLFKNMMTVVVAIAGAIPLIVKILGSFKSQPKSE